MPQRAGTVSREWNAACDCAVDDFLGKPLGFTELRSALLRAAGEAGAHPEGARVGDQTDRDPDVIDETPAAYKDIDAVMEAQRDLVEIVHTLKQVVCVKG